MKHNRVHLYECIPQWSTNWQHVGFAYPKLGNVGEGEREFLYLTTSQYRQLMHRVADRGTDLKLVDDMGQRYYPRKGEPVVNGWILYPWEQRKN